MPTKTLFTPIDGTPAQICLALHSSLSPSNDLRVSGSETDVNLTFNALADGSYRQGVKIDFGAHYALHYHAKLAADLAATPTNGDAILLYMAWSTSATAGTGNSGGASGTDAAYTGIASNAGDSILLVDHVSTFICTDDVALQVIDGWSFVPKARYGCPIVRNESGAAFASSDANSHLVLNPMVPEFQDT